MNQSIPSNYLFLHRVLRPFDYARRPFASPTAVAFLVTAGSISLGRTRFPGCSVCHTIIIASKSDILKDKTMDDKLMYLSQMQL